MTDLKSPSAEAVRTARLESGLTQAQAADLVHVIPRGWRFYESGDRKMHAAMWELFLIKIGKHPDDGESAL